MDDILVVTVKLEQVLILYIILFHNILVLVFIRKNVREYKPRLGYPHKSTITIKRLI